jgi:membrane protein DedA with SNARE-associated domain/rhodanese-related sulfurtransferase
MNTLIELVQVYGLWMIFVITLLQSIGLPLPSFAILIVTAAVRPPDMLVIILLVLAGASGSLIGDILLYFAGKKFGTSILGRLCKISLSPDSCVKSSGDIFKRFGPPALTLMKFVPGLSTIAPVVAGVYGMSIFSFVAFSIIAASVYTLAAVSLGVYFRHEISGLLATLTQYGQMGLVLIITAFSLYLLIKWLRRYFLIRQFKADRVTVGDLLNMMAGKPSPVIFDVRPADQRTKNGFIPDSILINSADLQDIAEQYSANDEIIIYCSCPNEITAAKYAQQLRKTGLKRIRPLLGGIDEWAKSGGKIVFS